METTINTYSPTDVYLNIGRFTCQSWKSIEIERTVGFRTIRGIRGKNTRVANPDTSATIRVQVLQTSHTNDVLSAIHDQDLDEKTGRLEVLLTDKSGSSVFKSSEAYLMKFPRAVYSGELVYHEWEIFCQKTTKYLVGGNNKPETKLFDSLTSALSGLIQ